MVVQGLNNALPQQKSLQSDDLSEPRKCVETPFSCKKNTFQGQINLGKSKFFE